MSNYDLGQQSLDDKFLKTNVPGRYHTWEHDDDEVAEGAHARAEWHDAEAYRDAGDYDDDDVAPAPPDEHRGPHADYAEYRELQVRRRANSAIPLLAPSHQRIGTIFNVD